jgi:hypothetical protein
VSHGLTPCQIVKTFPAILNVPLCGSPVGTTEKETVPVPVPLGPSVGVENSGVQAIFAPAACEEDVKSHTHARDRNGQPPFMKARPQT